MAEKNIPSVKKGVQSIVRLNTLFQQTIDSNNTGAARARELDKINQEVEDIISKDLTSIDEYTGDETTKFIIKSMNTRDKNQTNDIKSIQDIFEKDSDNILSAFQQKYKNVNAQYDDFTILSKNLFELQEALSTTRDAIVTSDDLSSLISRTIRLSDKTENSSEHAGYLGAIEELERKFKLPQKIKNHIIPNTLRFGKYYVYTVPYSELFTEHVRRKFNREGVKESMVVESFTADQVTEQMADVISSNKTTSAHVMETMNSYLEHIEIIPDNVPLMEASEAGIDEMLKMKLDAAQKEDSKKSKKQNAPGFSEGTFDPNDKENDFSAIRDCYIQLIDPRKIIPVKIMNETIGYYHIIEEAAVKKKSPFTNSFSLNSANSNPDETENRFLDALSSQIVQSFGKKYLEANAKFKDLILGAIQYHDIYKKKLKFQFIPVDYITEFSINQDEEGEGQSMLLAPMFYAKLYLALLVFKMISIISKSNDTKINYVRTGLEKDVSNKVQELARTIRSRNVNFSDLMSHSSIMNKVGAAREIFMPVGSQNERGIEFDILSGQNVELNTELMEMLRSSFINATGVPSVIMNYVNEADYAKTLVMANAKFLTRVVSLQMDFNPSITELYKKVILYSSKDIISEEATRQFEYKLSPPKALNTMNTADLINNVDQTVAFVVKAITGENASPSELDNMVKDKIYLEIAKDMMPMLPWASIESMYQDAKVEAEKRMMETQAKKNEDE